MIKMKRLMWPILASAVFVLSLSGPCGALEWGTKELDTEKLAVKFATDVQKGGYQIVTTEELKALMDKKENMLIVDTMPFEDSFKKNHLPGAVNFVFPMEEVGQLDDKTKSEYEKLLGGDKNRVIVVYCGFTKCGRSHNGAMWAKKLGYTNVYRYPGGIKAWMEADYPVGKVQ